MIKIENVNKKKTNFSNEKKFNNLSNIEEYNSESTNVDEKDNSSIYEEDLMMDKNNLIINNILNVLTLLIKDSEELEKNKSESMTFSQFHFYNVFNSETLPKISLKNYLIRILKYSEIEINTLIGSVIYLDYICNKNYIISKYNIYKLLFISILISAKFNEDVIYDNSTFSEISGLPINEVNQMENVFFKAMDYNLFISEEHFNTYKDILENNICMVS
jgi:phosphate system cyclin PHO80